RSRPPTTPCSRTGSSRRTGARRSSCCGSRPASPPGARVRWWRRASASSPRRSHPRAALAPCSPARRRPGTTTPAATERAGVGAAPVALVGLTLLAVYRAPVPALISLLTLGAALGVTFGAITLAARLGLPIAYQSRAFVVALLFGIGTDYCLLLFARVRETA